MRDIGPELRPNDYKQKVGDGERKPGEEKGTTTGGGEPSTLEDLGEQLGFL